MVFARHQLEPYKYVAVLLQGSREEKEEVEDANIYMSNTMTEILYTTNKCKLIRLRC